MTESTKFRIFLGIAVVLYAWGLGALWVAHDWGLSTLQYLFVAILPVLGGVMAMVQALIEYIGLLEEDDEAHTTAEESRGDQSAGPR